MAAETFLVYSTDGSEVAVTTSTQGYAFTVRVEEETLLMTRTEGEALHAALARALGFTD